jgi:hypothetical protein
MFGRGPKIALVGNPFLIEGQHIGYGGPRVEQRHSRIIAGI